MRVLTLATAIAALLFVSASAQEATAPPQARYEMKPVEGGFLRLDRQSGLTDLCSPSGDGYACRPTAEGKSADAAMIASLEKRVADLEAKVKALSPDPTKPAPDPTLNLPTDEQIDRVATFLERALMRLKKIAAQAQENARTPR